MCRSCSFLRLLRGTVLPSPRWCWDWSRLLQLRATSRGLMLEGPDDLILVRLIGTLA